MNHTKQKSTLFDVPLQEIARDISMHFVKKLHRIITLINIMDYDAGQNKSRQLFVIDKTRIEQSDQRDLEGSGVEHLVESYNQDLFESCVLEQIDDIYQRSVCSKNVDDLGVTPSTSNQSVHRGNIRNTKAVQLKRILYECDASNSTDNSSDVRGTIKFDSFDKSNLPKKRKKDDYSESDYVPTDETEGDEESDEEPVFSRNIKFEKRSR
uniref:Uncharacterized protein n=1 Tax=Romanomermis culicivorax TaxID=13658 RepID=A0A915KI61_ROMCU